jgi:hypothetical protein
MSETKRTLSEIVEELRPGVVSRTRASMLQREPGSCMHGLLNCTHPSCRPSIPASSGLADFRTAERQRIKLALEAANELPLSGIWQKRARIIELLSEVKK